MSDATTRLIFALAVAGAALAISQPAPAQQLTATEKLYADLAKLDPAERQKQLEAGAAKEKKLNFINHSGGRGKNIVDNFTKRYSFIGAGNIDGPFLQAPDATERFYNEEVSGRHLTDAIIIASPLDYGRHFEKKMIAHYPTPAESRILPYYSMFKDPENRWLPYNVEEHGMSYNPNLLKKEDAPKAWTDLCNPKYMGKVSYDPAEPGFLAGLHSMLGYEKTKELLECIGKNKPIVQMGHSARLLLMYAGDHWIQGDNFLYRGVSERKEALAKGDKNGAPFEPVYEAPLLISTLVGIINANTPNPYTAALMVDSLVTEEVQAALLAEGRAVTTKPHPFFPPDVTMVPVRVVPLEDMNKMHDDWVKYIGLGK
jgi:ABC-type Fe3+ transport system substrate-binding protein